MIVLQDQDNIHTYKEGTMNTETAKLLAAIEPGPGRWWKVELERSDRRVVANPITVSLMETTVEGKLNLSTRIGSTRTTASPARVRAAADKVLDMVGDYEKVVGNYPEGAR